MTSRTRTTCPLNQRSAAGGYEKWSGSQPPGSLYRKLDGINAELLDRTEVRWPPPPAGARLAMVDDNPPYGTEPSTPAEPAPMPPMPPTPWVDDYLANEAMVEDEAPYLIAPPPPTPPSPSTSAETPPSADPDRPT
jgi:hypothetical protein